METSKLIARFPPFLILLALVCAAIGGGLGLGAGALLGVQLQGQEIQQQQDEQVRRNPTANAKSFRASSRQGEY